MYSPTTENSPLAKHWFRVLRSRRNLAGLLLTDALKALHMHALCWASVRGEPYSSSASWRKSGKLSGLPKSSFTAIMRPDATAGTDALSLMGLITVTSSSLHLAKPSCVRGICLYILVEPCLTLTDNRACLIVKSAPDSFLSKKGDLTATEPLPYMA